MPNVPKVCPTADLSLQGVRHVRYQTGPAQRVAELLHRAVEPSVLSARVRFGTIGLVAVC